MMQILPYFQMKQQDSLHHDHPPPFFFFSFFLFRFSNFYNPIYIIINANQPDIFHREKNELLASPRSWFFNSRRPPSALPRQEAAGEFTDSEYVFTQLCAIFFLPA